MGTSTRGNAGACENVRRRAGGHLDPDIVEVFLRHADEILDALQSEDMLEAAIAAEPAPAETVHTERLQQVCLALAVFTDLKGTHLIGHSAHVTDLATSAARLAGMADAEIIELQMAALVHDIGRTAISSSIWEQTGPLGPADRERVRLHTYWTERILLRCPPMSSLARTAAAHHERLDGSGYHRGASGSELSGAARLLGAADAFAAMTETRPHRTALTPDAAMRALTDATATGKIDSAAAASVIEAAGLPRPRPTWPCGLTEREVEVLRLCARGLSNGQIADQLVVSARTVQHHLGSIYDKTGRRTRAGAAVFAVEHGLATW